MPRHEESRHRTLQRIDAKRWDQRQAAERSAAEHCPEISRVISRLWQGALPIHPERLEGFDILLLCALELQPPSTNMPVKRVVRIPLDDAEPTTLEEIAVRRTARRVADAWQRHQRILITCAMGWNRSGLVTGLTLRALGYTGEEAVQLIRRARGPQALSNPWFEEVVRS